MSGLQYDHDWITSPKGEVPAYMGWIFCGMGGVLLFGLLAFALTNERSEIAGNPIPAMEASAQANGSDARASAEMAPAQRP